MKYPFIPSFSSQFMAFVETERIKHTIMLREGKTSLWSYFSHCSAMCVLIALAVCQGPLLYDYTLIYKVNSNQFKRVI